MEFAIVLIATLLVCWLCHRFIKDYPGVCYGLCIAVDLLYVYGYFFGLPRELWLLLSLLIQKCMLALALFTIVMYIGVLPKKVKSSTSFLAIRANMSIMACFLALAHMGVYLGTYLTGLLSGSVVKTNVLVSFVVALAVFALLLVLGVTSFQAVKKSMKTASWKKLQKLAYPFFLLTYVHLVIVLAPAAAHGGEAAVTTIAVYSVVFGLYAVLRAYRAFADRREDALAHVATPASSVPVPASDDEMVAATE